MTALFYALFVILSAYNAGGALPSDFAAEPVEPCPKNTLKRTLFGILWSCMTTIILSAWTAVHPNVPPRGRWRAQRQWLKLMVWTIVAPELVLMWAVKQLFAAKEVVKWYNDELAKKEKWTLRHGFLFEMGGFVFVDPHLKDADPDTRRETVLTIEYFRANPRKVEMPHITADDIQDWSKGGYLYKVIAVVQTSWFIVQCVARLRQGLALAQLELLTLAVATLNLATCVVWWCKPHGILQPIRLYVQTGSRPPSFFWGAHPLDVSSGNFIPRLEPSPPPAAQEVHWDDFPPNIIVASWRTVTLATVTLIDALREFGKRGSIQSFLASSIVAIYAVSFPFFILLLLGTTLLLRIVELQPVAARPWPNHGLISSRIVANLKRLADGFRHATGDFFTKPLMQILGGDSLPHILFSWFIVLPFLFAYVVLLTIAFSPVLILRFFFSFLVPAVMEPLTTRAVPVGAPHVPCFYAHSPRTRRLSHVTSFAIIGITFGGLHLIGWNLHFQTYLEQSLWRYPSLAVTGIPLFVLPVVVLVDSARYRSFERIVRVPLLIGDIAVTILLFIYVLARLFLIAQAFALLRRQPSSALVAVDWIRYFPHFF